MGTPKLTRAEFEKELAVRLKDISALYKRYNPNAFEENRVYLSMCIMNGHLRANNRSTYTDNDGNTDKDAPCDFWVDEEGTMYSTKI